MVVSGAPEKEDNHAEKVCDMALDMVDAITDLKDPSTGKRPYKTYCSCLIQLILAKIICLQIRALKKP